MYLDFLATTVLGVLRVCRLLVCTGVQYKNKATTVTLYDGVEISVNKHNIHNRRTKCGVHSHTSLPPWQTTRLSLALP